MTETTEDRRTVPYVSWGTLNNQIERMTTEGVPTKIDKYFLTGMAGGTQAHLKHGLRALGLLDGEDRATPDLVTLASQNEEQRRASIAVILNKKFPELTGMDSSASKSDVLAVFTDLYGIKSSDTLRKALSFYVAAAEYSGVPVSPYIKSGRAPSGPRKTTAKRRKPKNVQPGDTVTVTQVDEMQKVTLSSGRILVLTLSGGNITGMPVDERNAYFGLVDAMAELASDTPAPKNSSSSDSAKEA